MKTAFFAVGARVASAFTGIGLVLILTLALTLALAGCNSRSGETTPANVQAPTLQNAMSESSPELANAATHTATPAQRLTEVLGTQPDSVKARYAARHPEETLLFFGVEPGMTVIEGDPGGGWYSSILLPFLGEAGSLVGADYPMEVYRLFDYYSEEELEERATWADRWPQELVESNAPGASVEAYAMGSLPAALEGRVDVVLLVRVLHNLADYEAEGGYLTSVLAEVYRALKPGGVLGIVQHQGPESHSDAWASGGNGYLKKSFVIDALEGAGFVFDGESAVNENPLDQPSEEESVWRLAPTLEEVDDAERAATYAAIGESNRMTLRFRKPDGG